MKNSCIKSYPFTGCSFEKIKKIGDRISILYKPDGDFDVYFCDKLVEGNVKNVLCYFLFLTRQIDKFNISDKSYSVNTYLDIILMSINEFISLSKRNNILFNKDEILSSINQEPDNYRYFSSIVDMLMDDCYFIDIYSTNSCIEYSEKFDGELTQVVSYVLNNEYGFERKRRIKTISKKACI